MARAPRALAAGAGHAGGPAVLDLVPDPHLCLDQHPAARGPAQPGAARARHRRRAAGRGSRPTPRSISASSTPTCRSWCCRSTPRWRRWTRRCSRPRPTSAARRWKAFWLVTLPLSLPGVVAGALLCFIPIVGEFVIPDLLGGSRHADDRPDAVDRVLRQPRLAGRLGGRGRAAARCWSCRSWSSSSCRRATWRRRDDDAPGILASTSSSLALGLAFLYLPIVDPGDLFVQRLAAGHGLGRLVDALVRRAAAAIAPCWTRPG